MEAAKAQADAQPNNTEQNNDHQNRLSQERIQLIDLAQDVLQHPENVDLIGNLIRPALQEIDEENARKGLV